MLAAADLMARQQALYAADLLWSLARAAQALIGNEAFDAEAPSRFARMLEGRAAPEDRRDERQITDEVIARLDALDLQEDKT